MGRIYLILIISSTVSSILAEQTAHSFRTLAMAMVGGANRAQSTIADSSLADGAGVEGGAGSVNHS